MIVRDRWGNEAEAIFLDGPTILGVEGGDTCVEADTWAIYYQGTKPIPKTQEEFEAEYTEVG